MFQRSIPLALLLASSFGVAGCDGTPESPSSSSTEPATSRARNAWNGRWLEDPHLDGRAEELRVEEVFWARLADVYDRDPDTGQSLRRATAHPIAGNLASDGQDYELVQNHMTGRWKLTILHPAGSERFEALFAALDRGAEPVLPSAGAHTVVPRNAALVVRFSDLVDEQTVDADTVQVLVGALGMDRDRHAVNVAVDPVHGGVSSVDGLFHSTRVVIDLAGRHAPGLPPARQAGVANVTLHLPGAADPATGRMRAVSNLASRTLGAAGAVRTFRSGSGALGDPHAGLLIDNEPPRVIGVQAFGLTKVRPVDGPSLFLVAIAFSQGTCHRIPVAGDGLTFPSHIAEVVRGIVQPVPSAGGAIVSRVLVQLVSGNPMTFAPGIAGQLHSPFRSNDAEVPECFVSFAPQAGGYPNQGVSPTSSVRLRFSEAMDAKTVQAFDTFEVLRRAGGAPLEENVVGDIAPAVAAQEFLFRPTLPLDHQQGSAERYRVVLESGLSGVLDLSGNPLEAGLPETEFFLDANASSSSTSGVSLVFDSTDEDGNGAPELRGQVLFDLQAEIVRPRPVARFSAQVDASTAPIVGAMIPFPYPLQGPLNPYGARQVSLWRYADMGFGLTDEATMNLDVEGLWWSPSGGVTIDTFGEFRMALAHAKVLPDEFLAISFLPMFPFSGVVKTFADNLLDPLKVVHPKSAGYVIDPASVILSPSGNPLVPWPMNRGLPLSQYTRYTWRDTALTSVGGANGGGVDLRNLGLLGQPSQEGLYGPGEVPSIGLPLMTEIRCYPDSGAFGLNAFKVNLAVNSSSRPNFRAFSGGGVLSSGQTVLIDPDNEPVATGGISPAGIKLPPGTEVDNSSFEGQADFVVRVSRAHTIWFDTGSAAPAFAPVSVEPRAACQPVGTQVVLAYRGADLVTPGNGTPPAAEDATRYDFYGDLRPATGAMVSFLNGDAGWKADPTEIDGARYAQVRISLIGDPVSGLTPELSALGLAYTVP